MAEEADMSMSEDAAIWGCKIGHTHREALPHGSDHPMRQAVRRAYFELTGDEPEFIFSGWGTELTEPELAVVENREPRYDPLNDTTDAAVWANEFMVKIVEQGKDIDWGLMVGWFANAIEVGRRFGHSEGISDASAALG